MTEQTAVVADNRVVHDMDIDVYHAHHAVSRSGLLLMQKSPQHYWYEYLSGMAEKKDTSALRIGGAFHALVLEPHTFDARAVVLPEGAPKRPSITQLNAAKPSEATVQAIQWWQQWDQYANGKIVLTREEFAEMQLMADAIRNQRASSKVLVESGKIESSFFWYDADFGVHVKARPDYYRDDGIVLDLKTTRDASKDAFQKAIVDYGYDIQAFMQMEGIERCTGKRPENFVFICVEKEPPYPVAFYVADKDMIECGRYRYQKLMSKFSDCQRSGVWPGYGELIQSISVPSWFLNKLEKEAA